MDPLIKLYASIAPRQRIAIAAAAILTVAGIFGFVHWKRESDFRPLYKNMAAEDAAGVVQKLRETGIDYRLSESGGDVLVPTSKLAESRLALAAAGLPKTGRIGFELFDKTGFGATDFVEHINYKRALEGELERTVMSLAEIEQARVHLTLPKESIFLDKQQPAKASVVLKIAPGAQVSQRNVLAMTNLVASAVEGLVPGDVSIVDMNGNLLSRPRRAGDADGTQASSEALELRQQVERDLVTKIRSTLEPLIGADRFRAAASVDYDLTSGEQQEETFDPSRSVMVSSQKTEDVTERASSSAGPASALSNAGGIPGTASNLPSPAPRSAGGSGGVSRRTENVAFQTTRVVKHTRIPQGMVRRMSLSVLLDHTVRWEGEGAAKRRILEPPSPEALKTIKDLVAATTGFNAERGDQLIVESLPFESTLKIAPPAGQPDSPGSTPASRPGIPLPKSLEKYRDLLLPVGVGLAVLLVLGCVVMAMVSRRKKAVVTPPPPALPPPDRQEPYEINGDLPGIAAAEERRDTEVAERVRKLVKTDTPVAANVLKFWIKESNVRSV